MRRPTRQPQLSVRLRDARQLLHGLIDVIKRFLLDEPRQVIGDGTALHPCDGSLAFDNHIRQLMYDTVHSQRIRLLGKAPFRSQ